MESADVDIVVVVVGRVVVVGDPPNPLVCRWSTRVQQTKAEIAYTMPANIGDMRAEGVVDVGEDIIVF